MKVVSGRTALVTGAARRIGREIALALAEAGVNVAIHFRRSADEAGKLRDELIGMGVSSWVFQADLAIESDRQRLIPGVIETTGSLDFLINSAAGYPEDNLAGLDFPGLSGSLETIAWAPFQLGRDFARRSASGKIVNLIDARIGGHDPRHVSYLLSKKILMTLTEMLAIELAPKFTVNAIAPGLVLPPEGTDHAYLDKLLKMIPLERCGHPREVAEAVLYLLSADYLTGQVIFVDGGRHLVGRTGGHP